MSTEVVIVNSNPALTQIIESFNITNNNTLSGDLIEDIPYDASYFNANIDNIIKLILYNRHSIDNFSLYKIIYSTTNNECEISTWNYPQAIVRPSQDQLKSYSKNDVVRNSIKTLTKAIYIYNLMNNASPELLLIKDIIQNGITTTNPPFEKIGTILNPALFN